MPLFVTLITAEKQPSNQLYYTQFLLRRHPPLTEVANSGARKAVVARRRPVDLYEPAADVESRGAVARPFDRELCW